MLETWTIAKEFRFEAAHRLPYHDGACSRLHGHSYIGKIFVKSSSLIEDGPKSAMVQDFSDIKAALKPLLDDYLDHHYLNETLETETTTAEFIAKWIYDRLISELPQLVAVRIDETCTSACVYSRAAETADSESSDRSTAGIF